MSFTIVLFVLGLHGTSFSSYLQYAQTFSSQIKQADPQSLTSRLLKLIIGYLCCHAVASSFLSKVIECFLVPCLPAQLLGFFSRPDQCWSMTSTCCSREDLCIVRYLFIESVLEQEDRLAFEGWVVWGEVVAVFLLCY